MTQSPVEKKKLLNIGGFKFSLRKSFTIYQDAYSAFNERILFQKQQELLYKSKISD